VTETTHAPDRPGSSRWFHPTGSLAEGAWKVVVDDRLPGWRHTGLRVADIDGDDMVLALAAAAAERLIIPLHGSFVVEVTNDESSGGTVTYELAGRESVFEGPTDTLYLTSGTGARIRGRGRVAVADSPTSARHPTRHLPRSSAPVELRGRGRSSRQVHDLGTPAVLEAERLIVCEVITPAGNWSSYPPHKHDEHRPGHESRLEEIYYFEVVPAAGAATDHVATTAEPFAVFAATSSPAVEIELDVRVRSGDVALIPGGYHGPAAAAPGYDLYYLNVMAGPDDRVWKIADDPRHAWVRETWASEQIDPRLPITSESNGADR
jgi:5-deoxy-glucuronate isomerase